MENNITKINYHTLPNGQKYYTTTTNGNTSIIDISTFSGEVELLKNVRKIHNYLINNKKHRIKIKTEDIFPININPQNTVNDSYYALLSENNNTIETTENYQNIIDAVKQINIKGSMRSDIEIDKEQLRKLLEATEEINTNILNVQNRNLE